LNAVSGNSIQSIEPDVSVIEGDAVTLSCSYSTSYSGVSLHWYRQNPSQAPQYVLQRGSNAEQNGVGRRFSAEFRKSSKFFSLTIKELEPTDSAMYFCRQIETYHTHKTSTHNTELLSLPTMSLIHFSPSSNKKDNKKENESEKTTESQKPISQEVQWKEFVPRVLACTSAALALTSPSPSEKLPLNSSRSDLSACPAAAV
uniref:Ig-like domain-containing protein n=1 Tax=Terrapene triunguis TaxID=2587831 RepID=A0A674IY22_9SAUR